MVLTAKNLNRLIEEAKMSPRLKLKINLMDNLHVAYRTFFGKSASEK